MRPAVLGRDLIMFWLNFNSSFCVRGKGAHVDCEGKSSGW